MARVERKYLPNVNASDIFESSFSGAESASGVNVTGLVFGSGVRSFQAEVAVHIDATSDLSSRYKLYGIQKTSGWELSAGDANGDAGSDDISFDINTSTGQVTYSSGTYTGFATMVMKFKAETLLTT